jgi:hypothetical protein
MIKMIHSKGGVITSPETPEILSRLMVHGFTQCEEKEIVTGVTVVDDEGSAVITDGFQIYDAIGEGCLILPNGEPAPAAPEVSAGETKTEE